jgi:hypothetical protein
MDHTQQLTLYSLLQNIFATVCLVRCAGCCKPWHGLDEVGGPDSAAIVLAFQTLCVTAFWRLGAGLGLPGEALDFCSSKPSDVAAVLNVVHSLVRQRQADREAIEALEASTRRLRFDHQAMQARDLVASCYGDFFKNCKNSKSAACLRSCTPCLPPMRRSLRPNALAWRIKLRRSTPLWEVWRSRQARLLMEACYRIGQ